MKQCPFCDTDLIGRTIEENESARIFFSNPRLTKGHLLVTPKRHVEEPWKLSVDETADIFALVRKYQEILATTLGTGCDVRQNYRPFLPQGRTKVDHVHFHLIPRTFADELYETAMQFETPLFQTLSNDERDAVLTVLNVPH